MIIFKISGGYARKRRRQADTLDIEERLESLITRVGEKVCWAAWYYSLIKGI